MKKSQEKDKIGKIGEEIALNHLKLGGYFLIKANYQTKYSEIDLVMQYVEVLVFVEVKTRTSDFFGGPEGAINYKKLKKLYFNAESFVAHKKWEGAYRIDAVCIVLKADNSPVRIDHYKNI